MWNRGYRSDDLRLYLDGYLAAPRQQRDRTLSDPSLGGEATSLYDPYNFEMATSQEYY